MSENKSPIIIALLASVVLIGLLMVGILFFLAPAGPESPEDGDPGVEVVDPEVKVGVEEEGSSMPEIVPVGEKITEALAINVVEEGSLKKIPNATVVIQRASEGDVGEEVFRGKSPVKTRLQPGAYVVRARAPSYTSRNQRITLIQGQALDIDVHLSRGLSITGRVLDSKRRGIGGATVRAYWELGTPQDDMIELLIKVVELHEMMEEPLAETISEADGTYHLDGLKDMYYTVSAIADGYTPREKKNINPSRTGVDLILPDGSDFSGTVVDQQGQPVPGAVVSVYPELDSQDIIKVIQAKARDALDRDETDSSGEFSFRTLGAGLYNLIIKAPGFQPGRYTKVSVFSGENPAQTYTLKDGLLLAGEIQDEAGKPIPGAKVRPIQIGSNVRNRAIRIKKDDGRIETDESGRFEFDTLEPGKYSLLAWHEDYAATQLRNVEVGNVSLMITLTTGGAVSGKIIAAGSEDPIPGARIVVNDLLDLKKTGVTDEDGNFYVLGISATRMGKRMLSVQADGYARVNNKSIKVEEGRVTENQNFELYPTASIAGRVVNSQGDGVARARVMARKRSDGSTAVPLPIGSDVSDEDGHFSITDVEGGDEIWLVVMHADYREKEFEAVTINPNDEIDVGELVLTLGGSIAGVVVDPEGNGVPDCRITTRYSGETAFSQLKAATTDNRGNFLVRGLNAGQLDIKVESKTYRDQVQEGVEVKEGLATRNIRIEVQPGTKLSGVILDTAERPVLNARVIVREFVGGIKQYQQNTDHQGRFTFTSLVGEDAVELEVEHSDYSPVRLENVIIGEEDLIIKLEPLGGVRGIIISTEGGPMTAFSVQPQVKSPTGEARNGKKIHSRTFQHAEGQFEYNGLPAGTYTVAISAPGFSATSIPEIVVQNGEIVDLGRVVLQEGGIIEGRVMDSQSGQPLGGARVRVQGGRVKFRPSSTSKNSPSTVMTDASGHFKISDLRGKVSLTVTLAGYVTERLQNIDTNDAAQSRSVVIELNQGGQIVGRVIDAQNNPMKKVNVYLQGRGELHQDTTVNQRTESQTDGSFSFKALRPGEYRVTAHDFKINNRPSVDLSIEAGMVVEVELVFE